MFWELCQLNVTDFNFLNRYQLETFYEEHPSKAKRRYQMPFSWLRFLHMTYDFITDHELLQTYISHIQSSLFETLNIIHFTCINKLRRQNALKENTQHDDGEHPSSKKGPRIFSDSS